MRSSELLGSMVADSAGATVGPVRDVRLAQTPVEGRLQIESLVVGGHELAHRFGYVDGRTKGPALIKWVLRRGSRDKAVVVAASNVATWGPGTIILSGTTSEVAIPIEQALHHENAEHA